MMLKKIIIISLSLFLFNSCSNEVPIEGFDSKVWKDDRLGCNGNRAELVTAIMDNKDQIIGLSEAVILKTFGRADFQELSKRNQKFYYYYFSPGPQCSSGLQGEKNQTVQIRLNSVGYANEILVNRF